MKLNLYFNLRIIFLSYDVIIKFLNYIFFEYY